MWKSRLDMDLIAIARAQGQACMQVFLVRGGKLIGQEHFILEGVYEQSDGELMGEFLKQFYTARTAAAPEDKAYSTARVRARQSGAGAGEAAPGLGAAAVPKELLVSALPDERATIESWLSGVKGQRVRILQPQRGARAEYLRLVAEERGTEPQGVPGASGSAGDGAGALADRSRRRAGAARTAAPHRVLRRLEHPGHQSGRSMVVFVEGRAKKSEYRKFKIQYDRGPNDFAMMQETLRRRLRYLRRETDRTETPIERELAKKEKFNKKPDLLLIDGGKGQLSAVVEVLEELDMTGLVAAGLAKEHEWLYLPQQADPIVLPPNSPGLHLIQRIRDEAHRFAVTYHRQRRAKSMTQLGARRAFGRRAGAEETAADGVRVGGRNSAREPRRNRCRQRDDACFGSKGKTGPGRRVTILSLLLRFLVNAFVLYLIAKYVPGFNHNVGVWTAIVAAIVFGLVNMLIGPILRLISFPITWITHGLFAIVINYILFIITVWIAPASATPARSAPGWQTSTAQSS